jgi:hypothetical protein
VYFEVFLSSLGPFSIRAGVSGSGGSLMDVKSHEGPMVGLGIDSCGMYDTFDGPPKRKKNRIDN